jgi:hypothetical protein
MILQEQLVPDACRALSLIDDQSGIEQELQCCMIMAEAAAMDDTTKLENPIQCVTTLLSNMILQSAAEGYDGRVRHVLRTACVQVLSQKEGIEEETGEQTVLTVEIPVSPCAEGPGEDIGETGSDIGSQDGHESHNSCGDESSCGSSSMDTEEIIIRQKNKALFVASRKFQLIENAISARMVKILMIQQAEIDNDADAEEQDVSALSEKDRQQLRRRRVVRGLQITGVGVVVGSLFAVTGGLAGPAIAAGIAGLGIVTSTSAATTIAMLTTVKAAAALFGLGGGGLAAYKMKKRTAGLKEFKLRRENIEQNTYLGASDETIRRGIEASLPQLHTTICISGWLKDKSDYQRPWGIQPTDPPIHDKIELLKRFFAVHNPDLVATCEEVIKARRKKERKEFSWDLVWKELEDQYGRSPDHLLPLNDAECANEVTLSEAELTSMNLCLLRVFQFDSDTTKIAIEHKETVSSLDSNEDITDDESKSRKDYWSKSWWTSSNMIESFSGEDETRGEEQAQSCADEAGGEREFTEAPLDSTNTELTLSDHSRSSKEDPQDLLVVWDWQSTYGGDLHTLTWDPEALLGLCHIVNTMAAEVTSQATKFALQFSIIGAIVAAVAIPSALLTASQLIDDPYQIVILRADEAGKELAKCLLQSEERRPVTLVGYSFGARVIDACLRELYHQQLRWEKQQQRGSTTEVESSYKSKQDDDVFEYNKEPASIVEDVVFMGLPRIVSHQALSMIRQVAGGRMINCYTKKDWFLSLMFTARGGTQTCGTSPIEGVGGIENYDVSGIVKAHKNYPEAVPAILERVYFGSPMALVNNVENNAGKA